MAKKIKIMNQQKEIGSTKPKTYVSFSSVFILDDSDIVVYEKKKKK